MSSSIESLEPMILMSASGGLDPAETQVDVMTAIVFDLNDDGEIGITGETTKKDKSTIDQVGILVEFDIDGDGDLEIVEWLDGSGDGILVDSSKISDGVVTGSALFGDESGAYANGYVRLAERDVDGNNLLESGELISLQLWLDDGDAKLESGELRDLADYDIFSIATIIGTTTDLMQSNAFLLTDAAIMTESAWFVSCGDAPDNPAEEPVNSAPNAVLDYLTTNMNAAQEIDVLENDTDLDGDTLSVLSFAQPQHGTVTEATDGTLTYTPEDGFVGVDYFVYVVTDGESESLTTVRVDVVQVVDNPNSALPNGDANQNAGVSGNPNAGKHHTSRGSLNAAQTALAAATGNEKAAKNTAIIT